MSDLTAEQIENAHGELFAYSAEFVETVGNNHLSIASNNEWAVWTWDEYTAECDLIDRGHENSYADAYSAAHPALLNLK